MSDVRVEISGDICSVILDRPAEHNSLTLPFLQQLRSATATAVQSSARIIVMRAVGQTFSTGGDIKVFLTHAEDAERLTHYSAELVGALNDIILSMIRSPVPFITQLQGLVTGGSAGFLFASDHCLMADHAFLQPYYGEVGFAPDGGWTALLPLLTNQRFAMTAVTQNRRIDAQEALARGLIDACVPAAELEGLLDHTCHKILSQDENTIAATKRLLWPQGKIDLVATALEAERQAFIAAIQKPECAAKMQAFVASLQSKSQTKQGGRAGGAISV